MEGGKYYECLGTPRNEDFHCSDSLSFEISKYETFIYDHRHYFGHKVAIIFPIEFTPTKFYRFRHLEKLAAIPAIHVQFS